MRLVLIAAYLFILAPKVFALDLGTYSITEEGFDFQISSQTAWSLNRMTSIWVTIKAKDPMGPPSLTRLEFDARMPEHNHGMVVQPKVTEIGLGQYQIDGIKFHMAGAWELSFKFYKGIKMIPYVIPTPLP